MNRSVFAGRTKLRNKHHPPAVYHMIRIIYLIAVGVCGITFAHSNFYGVL